MSKSGKNLMHSAFFQWTEDVEGHMSPSVNLHITFCMVVCSVYTAHLQSQCGVKCSHFVTTHARNMAKTAT